MLAAFFCVKNTPTFTHRISVQAMSMSTKAATKPLIIFCHGSGDTGSGAQAYVQSLIPNEEYEKWDWEFPTATPIPYTIYGGRIESIWYDRVRGFAPQYNEQTASVEASTDRLLAIIDKQVQQNHRSSKNIIIGGFSMGGAIALQTAVRYHARNNDNQQQQSTTTTTNTNAESAAVNSLGAVFGLSCYLTDDSKVWKILQETNTAKNWPSTFIAHGGSDNFILPKWGKSTYERLVETGIPATFQMKPNTSHEMVHTEIAQLLGFLTMEIKLKETNTEL